MDPRWYAGRCFEARAKISGISICCAGASFALDARLSEAAFVEATLFSAPAVPGSLVTGGGCTTGKGFLGKGTSLTISNGSSSLLFQGKLSLENSNGFSSPVFPSFSSQFFGITKDILHGKFFILFIEFRALFADEESSKSTSTDCSPLLPCSSPSCSCNCSAPATSSTYFSLISTIQPDPVITDVKLSFVQSCGMSVKLMVEQRLPGVNSCLLFLVRGSFCGSCILLSKLLCVRLTIKPNNKHRAVQKLLSVSNIQIYLHLYS